MNRILLSVGLALSLVPLAFSARADSLGVIDKALSSLSRASSGPQKSFILGVGREQHALQAKHQLAIEQSARSASTQAKSEWSRSVDADRRTLSVYPALGSTSFRIDRHGDAIRRERRGYNDSFKDTYSDGAGRPLSKIGGWLRWKAAKTPLFGN